MKITMRVLDFWLAKGFGGIINILHTRISQIPAGFSSVSQKLMAIEARRLSELNNAMQVNTQEEEHPQQTDMACIDNWFIKAFTGLDMYLKDRASQGPVPINAVNIEAMEEHVAKIQDIINKEKEKLCLLSRGKRAA